MIYPSSASKGCPCWLCGLSRQFFLGSYLAVGCGPEAGGGASAGGITVPDGATGWRGAVGGGGGLALSGSKVLPRLRSSPARFSTSSGCFRCKGWSW
jgi:hypothetical protein